MVVLGAGVIRRRSILRQLTFESALWLTVFETVEVRNKSLQPFNGRVLGMNCTSSSTNSL